MRETITYPKVTVTSDFDPCHDKSSPFEHVLTCRHLITTPEPNEPCAPNCHHVTTEKAKRKVRKMSLNMAMKKEFYCDACVEIEGEREIPATASCRAAGKKPWSEDEIITDKTTAENQRAGFCKTIAARRNKAHEFRKCYIAQKIISVPCDGDGDTVEGYFPHPDTHPFDTAWPPTGENMFEDVEVTPTKAKKSKKKEPSGKSRPSITTLDESGDEATSADEAVAEDVDETIAEGARWLREQEDLTRRREAEGTPSTRRRHAAARPIVISSSPDTGMSSFVVHDLSPPTAQTSRQSTTSSPEVPRKGNRKRKRVTQDETATAPTAQSAKRSKATPKTPNTAQATKPKRISSKAWPLARKTSSSARGAMAQSKSKVAKKPSKRVCGVL